MIGPTHHPMRLALPTLPVRPQTAPGKHIYGTSAQIGPPTGTKPQTQDAQKHTGHDDGNIRPAPAGILRGADFLGGLGGVIKALGHGVRPRGHIRGTAGHALAHPARGRHYRAAAPGRLREPGQGPVLPADDPPRAVHPEGGRLLLRRVSG